MWWRVLRENQFAVAPTYWHRGALVTLTSILNSCGRWRENRRYAQEIEETEIKSPIFILGHWRSGTTHLHNLLTQDTERFAYPNTYQVVNPYTFLTTENINTKLFAGLVPKTRLMDNMAMGFELPQEDEVAPCLMTGLSPYLGICFPKREAEYERFLTFEDATDEEVAAWKDAMRWFVKKLTFKYQKPIILKSPAHTARIDLLLDAFPNARFVNIHRNPYHVFRSTVHYFDTAVWYSYLQLPDRSKVVDTILIRYQNTCGAFFDQRSNIPAGRFHELSYDELERDPVGAVEGIYAGLSLGDFEAARPELEDYVSTLAEYKKNTYDDLDPETKELVAEKWARSFEEWGYPK